MAEPEGMCSRIGGWACLPPELLTQVLQHLGTSDKRTVEQVCRAWRSVLINPASGEFPWGGVRLEPFQCASRLLSSDLLDFGVPSTTRALERLNPVCSWLAARASGMDHVNVILPQPYQMAEVIQLAAIHVLPLLLVHLQAQGQALDIWLTVGRGIPAILSLLFDMPVFKTLYADYITIVEIDGNFSLDLESVECLCHLTRLQRLSQRDSFDGSPIPVKAIPASIGQLTRLVRLQLSNRCGLAVLPVELARLHALTHLELRDFIGTNSMQILASLSSLRHLDMRGSRDVVLPPLLPFLGLTRLYLPLYGLTGHVRGLSLLQSLRCLKLSSARRTVSLTLQADFHFVLRQLTALRKLAVTHTADWVPPLELLSVLSSLTALSLKRTPLQSLEVPLSWQHLRTLNLSRASMATVPSHLQRLTVLARLNLDYQCLQGGIAYSISTPMTWVRDITCLTRLQIRQPHPDQTLKRQWPSGDLTFLIEAEQWLRARQGVMLF